jgi:hypothetical protein
MYPHERSLVSRMANKPFALLGVNSDSNRKELRDVVLKKEKITWRSWWDGGSTGGPIAKQYGVRGWPTIYVLDGKGVIRFKNIRGPDLDKAVDILVKELESSPIVRADTNPTTDEGDPKPAEAPKKTVAAPKPAVDEAKKAELVAESKLKLAKQLDKDGAKDKARTRYQEIVDKYPNTVAATEARELLGNVPK